MNSFPGNSVDKNLILQDLMVNYGHDVWNFAFSLIRNNHMADDITQDVFIKAFNKIGTFRGDSSVKTWLLAITRNTAEDYRRSAFLRKVTLVDYVSSNGYHPSAEKEALSHFVTEEVWQNVLGLPQKLREVLVLHLHNQLSITEIANLLRVPEGTVKTRLYRARAKMTNRIQPTSDSSAKGSDSNEAI